MTKKTHETYRMLWAVVVVAWMLIGLLPIPPIPVVQAATIVVTNLNNSGAGSLRQAILDANASAADDIIRFNVSGTITLGSQLPNIVDEGREVDDRRQRAKHHRQRQQQRARVRCE